jgi:ferrochelatase
VLREEAAGGRRAVVVVPVSFVSDHIETLYEIDILYGDEARSLGLREYVRRVLQRRRRPDLVSPGWWRSAWSRSDGSHRTG